MRPGSASYARLPADEIAELQAQIAQLQTELHPARTDTDEEAEEEEAAAERAGGLNAPPPPAAQLPPPSPAEHAELQRQMAQLQQEVEQLKTPSCTVIGVRGRVRARCLSSNTTRHLPPTRHLKRGSQAAPGRALGQGGGR